jgi:NADH:ubiquinone oxidoreductase subunit 5 (subunit L)/multisubunit Na+/H+ antiporter MnhA subunit
MEGPTPVRALLHRRTIVVAGVYLLFTLMGPILSTSVGMGGAYPVIIISRLLTRFLASFRALFHKDIKKVVALSTTRQLAFIIFLILTGQKVLAFLHIVLHGFFKALLFICSGVLIHDSGDPQDSRTIGSSKNRSVLFFNLFLIASIGLAGVPFIGAFFSKHQMIAPLVGGVLMGPILSMIFLLSISGSVAYRIRIVHFLIKPVTNSRSFQNQTREISSNT